jgi:flagellar motor switch protein FliN/FliY
LNKVETKTKINLKDSLYNQYNWFYKSFLPFIKLASNDFFSNIFDFQLTSVSKNMNILVQGDDYFVTKILIAKDYDAFFRCSEKAVGLILERILGKNKTFNFSGITELEARIISSFNDYLFNNISQFLLPVPESQKPTPESIKVNIPSKKRKNFDTIHLTFFIKDKILQEGGKLIVSLPQLLLSPEIITSQNVNFDVSNFKMSKIDVKILIGTTKFFVKDLKNLEKDDLVIFENSDIYSMKLIYKDYKKDFKINPNLGLTTSVRNNGGYNMEENSLSQDLWDNIQVEMGAEFEKVKITLGDLKHIEQGLVVDINSVYDNKVFLKVEDKIIAQGELVIINDRYGVRIDEVFATQTENIKQISQAESKEELLEQNQELTQENQDAEEEFDYSDFELDDQDI